MMHTNQLEMSLGNYSYIASYVVENKLHKQQYKNYIVRYLLLNFISNVYGMHPHECGLCTHSM